MVYYIVGRKSKPEDTKMNTRMKIVEALLKRADTHQREVISEALKYLSDTNLICLAQDLRIDTDAVFQEVK